jgi:6-phosphogluconolactonase
MSEGHRLHVFDSPVGSWPEFDLILLGMGADGHTASLLPGALTLHDTPQLVAAPFVEKLCAFRVTLTPGVIRRARAVIVLVTGTARPRSSTCWGR